MSQTKFAVKRTTSLDDIQLSQEKLEKLKRTSDKIIEE
jgi:hypothetical protein